MRSIIAFILKNIFRHSFFKYSYYGFYKRMFHPLNLFKGVQKTIIYRNKLLLVLDLEDWIPQNIYFLNEYEEKEIKFVEQFLKTGDCFIDIGANIGLFSLVASKIVGDKGKVFSFEPFTRNYEKISHHITLNKLKNIVVEKKAISDKAGTITLYLDEKENNTSMASAYTHDFTVSENVQAISIDEYVIDRNILALKLVKIDIEGGEYLALKGMENTIKKYKPTILAEINPGIEKASFPGEKIHAFLLQLGYQKYFLTNNGTISNKKMKNDLSHNYVFSIQN